MLRLTPSLLQCISPAMPAAGAVRVSVTANGQNFHATDFDFLYQPEVVIRALMPAHGGLEGGARVSLLGSGFSLRSHQLGYLRCRFNLTVVAPSAVTTNSIMCVAPPHQAGFASVEVTNNQQQFSDSGALFEYFANKLIYLQPVQGPVGGGTLIRVRIRSLQPASPLQCVFGDEVIIPATYGGADQFACISPPRTSAGTIQLRLVNGGTEFRSSLP